MRKMLAVFFSALFLVCLSACGKHNQNEQNTVHSTTDSVVTTTVGDTTATATATEVKATTTTALPTILPTTTTTIFIDDKIETLRPFFGKEPIISNVKTHPPCLTRPTTTTTKVAVFTDVKKYTWRCWVTFASKKEVRWTVDPDKKVVEKTTYKTVSEMFDSQEDLDREYDKNPDYFSLSSGEWYYISGREQCSLESITQSGDTVTIKMLDDGKLLLTRESNTKMKVLSNTTSFFEVDGSYSFYAQ